MRSLAGLLKNSLGGASCAMRPWSKNITRSATSRAKPISWVTHTEERVAAHFEGRNLQFANRNLALTASPDAMLWQQLIGRTHRQGQEADNVEIRFYAPVGLTRDKIEQARVSAKWLAVQVNEDQRLALADWEE